MSLSNGIKKQKKVFLVVVVVVVCTSIAFGIAATIEKFNRAMSRQYEDKNGDSKELCIITNDIIEQYHESYDAIGIHRYSEGLHASGVKNNEIDSDLDSYDNEYTEISIKQLSGLILCNAYLGTGKQVTYTVTSQVTKGNLKIVITDEVGRILYELPLDQESSISFVGENKKLYYLKFAGESAKFEATIVRTEN